METQAFSNFDLLIEPFRLPSFPNAAHGQLSDERYRVRVSAPPWGEAGPLEFAAPFSPQELSSLFSIFGRPVPDAARPAASVSDVGRDFGRRLFDAVFAGEILSFYRSSAKLAANLNTGLRVRLRLKDAPPLADLPWELVHDGQDFLALSSQLALVRYLESGQPVKPLAVTLPLRMLVILSSPHEYEALDVTREWHNIHEALADVLSTGLMEIQLLERPTLGSLQEQLRKNEYHILHFSGHGEFGSSANAQGALVFQDKNGDAQDASAQELARTVRDHKSLRLVVLNACEGARAPTRDAFAGVAQTLVQNGTPAVIAMQFAVTDQAAKIFAGTLYESLADGYAIDAGLGETRKAMANLKNSLEWATPVLFLRADDGKLFELGDKNDPRRAALKRAALLRGAEMALEPENFASASEFANQLSELDANDSAARDLREKIQRKREASEFYAQGQAARAEGRWQDAVNAFKQVQRRQMNYRETTTLLAEALRGVTTTGAPAARAPRADENEGYFKDMVRDMLRSKIVPFFGQGSNLYERAQEPNWQKDLGAPSGDELARYLAASFDYDEADRSDLFRVSQYVAVTRDSTALYDELHQILNMPYAPTPLHRFWAELPAQLRARGLVEFYPILITSNYDLLLEKAFHDQGEEFDSLIYLADGANKGKFLHRTHRGEEFPVDDPSSYPNMRLNERTTIIRTHGAVTAGDSPYESFVITEDDFLDLFQTDVASLLPRTVAARLRESCVLFMGCNFRNWNLRGLLYRLAKTKYRPWLIQPQIRGVEKEYWRNLNVRVLEMGYEEFLLNLSARWQSALAGGMP